MWGTNKPNEKWKITEVVKLLLTSRAARGAAVLWRGAWRRGGTDDDGVCPWLLKPQSRRFKVQIICCTFPQQASWAALSQSRQRRAPRQQTKDRAWSTRACFTLSMRLPEPSWWPRSQRILCGRRRPSAVTICGFVSANVSLSHFSDRFAFAGQS